MHSMIPPKILTTLTINFDPDGADHVDDLDDADNTDHVGVDDDADNDDDVVVVDNVDNVDDDDDVDDNVTMKTTIPM